MIVTRRLFPILVVAGAVLATSATWINPATLGASTFQESKSRSSRSRSSSVSDEKDREDKRTGRLPAYFGQVDLDEDQRQEIYDIQAEYQPQIDELLLELAELKAEMDESIEGVLTTTQKRKLTSLRTAGRSRSGKADADAESKPKSTRSSSARRRRTSSTSEEDEEDEEEEDE